MNNPVQINGTEYKRIINTYLKSDNKKFQDVISSVYGQLSDGKWENTPSMEKYWAHSDSVDYNGYIHIGLRKDCYAFDGKSDADVKRWFADKIKILVKEETGKWGRELQDHCEYLERRNEVPITISDAYTAYDILKERVGHEYGEQAQHTKELKQGKKESTELLKLIKEFNATKLSDIKSLSRAISKVIGGEGFNTLPQAQKDTFQNLYNQASEFIKTLEQL